MDISRNSYEYWFLDYLDGSLNAEQEEILMSFLEFNPDLKAELEETENLALEAEELHYDLKASLRKPVNNPVHQHILDNFEDYCVSGVEEQLSREEEIMLQEIIENDKDKSVTYRLYESTVLKADTSIVFPGKKRLKRRFISVPALRISIASAAAVAILLIVLPLIFRNTGEQLTDVGQLADIQEENISKGSPQSSGKSVSEAPDIPESPVISPAPVKIIPPDKLQETTKREFIHLVRLEPKNATALENIENSTVSVMADRLRREGDDYVNMDVFASQPASTQDQRERKLSLWRLADAGIQRIDQVSEEDYSFDRETDVTGKTRRITFETPLFGISAPLRNSNIPQ